MRKEIPNAVQALKENLSRLMEQRDLSDRAVAAAVGSSAVAPKTVNNMRHGRYPARLDKIDSVARKALSLPTWVLLVPKASDAVLNMQGLQEVIEHYIRSDERGRETIENVAADAAAASTQRIAANA